MFPQVSECKYIGKTSRPHGPEGFVLVQIHDVLPSFFNEIECVFIEIQQKLVPFFIQNSIIKGNNVYLQFDDINSVPQAEKICGLSMFTTLVDEEEEEVTHEFIGYSLFDEDVYVGKIVDIVEYPMHAVFVVETELNNELLVPYAQDLIVEVVEAERKIIMKLPEGLIE